MSRFEEEIQQAETARRNGNEGMARVCARRAAGVIAASYLKQRGILTADCAAYDCLRELLTLPDLAEDVRERTTHFVECVNTEYQLPSQADLITDARWLAQRLLRS